jgi:glycosyltransferase involved in cell wall biosynthesis
MGVNRVLIVAEHASRKFGGEAVLPLHYFRLLRKRAIEAWLIVHERTRAELDDLFPDDRERIRYVKDTRLHRLLWQLKSRLPRRLGDATFGILLRLLTQRSAVRMAKALIREEAIELVHQPIPVSPKDPSLLAHLGVPLVIGPLNGGMEYPAAFRDSEPAWVRALFGLGRLLSNLVHQVIRGKLDADVVLVANARTARALPAGVRGRVIELVENGVDLGDFAPPGEIVVGRANALRLLFVGRLIDMKRLDFAIRALARATTEQLSLVVLGEGPKRSEWQRLAIDLGVGSRVEFRGWVSPEEVAATLEASDALVMTSLCECGGAVVLEAMVKGLPVVAIRWGGPADYLDDTTGLFVEVSDFETMVSDFARAFDLLAGDPELRARLARAGSTKARQEYDWEHKLDLMLTIYANAIAARSKAGPAA